MRLHWIGWLLTTVILSGCYTPIKIDEHRAMLADLPLESPPADKAKNTGVDLLQDKTTEQKSSLNMTQASAIPSQANILGCFFPRAIVEADMDQQRNPKKETDQVFSFPSGFFH